MQLEQISPDAGKGRFRVVIETPRGSRNKYSYQPDTGAFLLKKVLPEGHVFPFDFGFIPQTEGEDGDPLDILVIMDSPAFPGCVVDCRLIGILQAEESEGPKRIRNDRYLAVAGNSVNYRRVKDIADLPSEMVDQIRHFFVSYNAMAGIEFKPQRLVGAGAARKRIKIKANSAQRST